MKKTLSAFALFLLIAIASNAQNGKTCNPAKEKPTAKNTKATAEGGYGLAISKEGATDVKLLEGKMENEKESFVKITGKVVEVCQVKGCWMTTDLGNGKTMRIRFKDYGFFMPKDCGGQTFYAQGIASWIETSIAELRHYAEDAGKSKAEIEKINAPEKALTFLAEGVILGKK